MSYLWHIIIYLNCLRLLLFNNHIVTDDELRLPLSNRAFQYNDGFFETIIIRQGRLRFWEAHEQRMQEAARALQLQLPPLFFSSELTERLLELATQQHALAHGRLKLKVWRAGAGLYTPETNNVDWLAAAQPTEAIYNLPLQVGVCRQTHTLYSPLSHFKGPNAPVYVQAGLEKKAHGKDDMLLLDRQSTVSEFTAANVFWIQGDALCTPPLETGCINGVLRRSILRWCLQQQVKVEECSATVEQLGRANVVFAANVTGIRAVGRLEESELPTQHPLLDRLQSSLLG
ncbi:aminotransferase class IV [Pontibacter russatus]|uniref:aminotransferase class IV n=1 Tax=Pontibacter russatus TaxID=2694929 RepID=UPI00137A64D3|nr:aminotransferase class IV [Pontibacter russatus]